LFPRYARADKGQATTATPPALLDATGLNSVQKLQARWSPVISPTDRSKLSLFGTELLLNELGVLARNGPRDQGVWEVY
jgi:hypothetical protein